MELKGESVEGEIKFGKWKSSQTGHGVLEFDMKEKHLRDCDRKFIEFYTRLIFRTHTWRQFYYVRPCMQSKHGQIWFRNMCTLIMQILKIE